MLAQVKITARRDAFEFIALDRAILLLAERKLEQDVRAGAGVVREFC